MAVFHVNLLLMKGLLLFELLVLVFHSIILLMEKFYLILLLSWLFLIILLIILLSNTIHPFVWLFMKVKEFVIMFSCWFAYSNFVRWHDWHLIQENFLLSNFHIGVLLLRNLFLYVFLVYFGLWRSHKFRFHSYKFFIFHF